ncbi:ester cyclase [Natrialba aegyptia]|uniref:Ester cyclase n=1 Tax=Natrialba aegyptia DSM 13077 TaxID=1227491 RepID=M0AUB7_9EURY|nr:ester cyclase [Natrialba aegyptia]ELZ02150.1 ester cyclase [Natrialba aegyptia DSM 13077]
MTDLPSTSQVEANKRLVRRIPEEIFAKGDLDLLDELYSEDAVERNAMGTHQGRPEIRESYNSFLTAFPDVSQTVENIVAEGDLVAVRITSRGTHTGELGGIEPTGKEIEVQQMFFARIEDGVIAERWFLPDNLSLLQQLGVIDFPPT